MTENPLLTTATGEPFQPVRLHYRVFDRDRLRLAVRKLRCVQDDPPRRRWVWLYDHEARKLRFQRSYAQLPTELCPVVIGSFFLRGNDELLLDLRSCERAVQAIPFFDRHLHRKVARVTEAEVVNRLFSASGNTALTPEAIFDRQPSPSFDPEAFGRRIEALVADIQDPQERFRIATEDMQARAKQPLPEIERFPVHYYDWGIRTFETTLKLRQIVAVQHWQGNPQYSLFDVIESIYGARGLGAGACPNPSGRPDE